MCEKMSSLNIGAKVCDDCRKKLAQLPTKVSESEELPESSEEDGAIAIVNMLVQVAVVKKQSIALCSQ